MSAVLSPADRYLMCERKRHYWSRIEAEIAGAATGHKLRAYRCPNCRGWHLTKKEKFSGTSRQRNRARRPR